MPMIQMCPTCQVMAMRSNLPMLQVANQTPKNRLSAAVVQRVMMNHCAPFSMVVVAATCSGNDQLLSSLLWPNLLFQHDVDTRGDWQPINYVEMYLDKQLFSLLSHCTNVTSDAVRGTSMNKTVAEIERFIGACLFMSCVSYHRVRMFWQKGLSVPVLSEAMTRDRLLPVRRYASVVFATATCPSVRPSVHHTLVLCLAERKQDREIYTIW